MTSENCAVSGPRRRPACRPRQRARAPRPAPRRGRGSRRPAPARPALPLRRRPPAPRRHAARLLNRRVRCPAPPRSSAASAFWSSRWVDLGRNAQQVEARLCVAQHRLAALNGGHEPVDPVADLAQRADASSCAWPLSVWSRSASCVAPSRRDRQAELQPVDVPGRGSSPASRLLAGLEQALGLSSPRSRSRPAGAPSRARGRVAASARSSSCSAAARSRRDLPICLGAADVAVASATSPGPVTALTNGIAAIRFSRRLICSRRPGSSSVPRGAASATSTSGPNLASRSALNAARPSLFGQHARVRAASSRSPGRRCHRQQQRDEQAGGERRAPAYPPDHREISRRSSDGGLPICGVHPVPEEARGRGRHDDRAEHAEHRHDDHPDRHREQDRARRQQEARRR